MIPSANGFLTNDLVFEKQPSKNFFMNEQSKRIQGYCDELEAMKQVVYQILNTERFQYLIFSWNYGVELIDLFGQPATYVCPELERRITEALLQDDRIEGVSEFAFEMDHKKVKVSFCVETVFGDIKAEKEVGI